jgi:cardiolipin synthase
MRRLPVGVSLAWLAIILIFPMVGAVFYLLVGEYRLGPGRARRAAIFAQRDGASSAGSVPTAEHFDPTALGRGPAALARLAHTSFGAPVLVGNHVELLPNADAAFPALIADIDRARRTCSLEFYIWSSGGRAGCAR